MVFQPALKTPRIPRSALTTFPIKERIEIYCNTPEQVNKWLVDLEKKRCEASLGLVLSCTSSVERININEYKELSSDSINQVLGHAAVLQSQGSGSPLALSRLTLIQGSFDDWAGLSWLLHFLRLNSVKTADLDRVVDDVKNRAETPTIEMDFLDLGVVVDGKWSRLDNFLSNFKTIKSIRLSEDGFERDPYNESEPHRLDAAISGVKHCLEDLEIFRFKRAPEGEPWISSLLDFQKLRRLSLYRYTLFKPTHKPTQTDIDWFPPSLEWLELVNYNQYSVDQLVQILQVGKKRCLNLCTLY